ncbi:glutamate-gated chloride channel [Caerostris extrusa]|uniref:Glutamate-gated chloride channel n=1 Tax=Caerostris extrusa TaxID=172846 RepID=A0AAV4X661_CAEEX|nr:glutamate-gated chloride channel [Caerostris extrusa]
MSEKPLSIPEGQRAGKNESLVEQSKYEVEFLLHQKWHDPRLKFDDAGKHRYLNGLMHADNIWLPDTYFIKHGEFKYPLIPINIALRIYPNGSVVYSMRRSMVLNCQGNLHIFPFDNLKCPFALESVSHEENEMELKWSETEQRINGATSLRQQNAYLVKNVTGPCEKQHTWRLFAGPAGFYAGQVLLHQHCVRAGRSAGDELLHQLLAGHQRSAGSGDDRRDHHVELLHHHQWLSFHAARRLQPDGHESVGRRVHVFHLRLHAGIHHRQLPVQETARVRLWCQTRIGAGARVPQEPVPCPDQQSARLLRHQRPTTSLPADSRDDPPTPSPNPPSTTACKVTKLGPRPPCSRGSGVLSCLSLPTCATGRDWPSRSTTSPRASSLYSSVYSPSGSSSPSPSSSRRSKRTSFCSSGLLSLSLFPPPLKLRPSFAIGKFFIL